LDPRVLQELQVAQGHLVCLALQGHRDQLEQWAQQAPQASLVILVSLALQVLLDSLDLGVTLARLGLQDQKEQLVCLE